MNSVNEDGRSPWWDAKARESLLPLSKAKNLDVALEEWSYTGNCYDHGDAVETCHLCGFYPLRYHFEIANDVTTHSLMVGSECIQRFGIAGGEQVQADRRELIRKAQEEETKRVIALILRETHTLDLTKAWTTKGGVSPKQAKWAAEVLHRNGYGRVRGFPAVRLRREDHKAQLRGMTPVDRGYVWPYLSTAQQALYAHLDRIAPRPVRVKPRTPPATV